jgi:hypothetical protein
MTRLEEEWLERALAAIRLLTRASEDLGAEVERLRGALEAAAKSLETISRAGHRGDNPSTLEDLIDVRQYATSRAKAAREVMG